MRGEHWTDLEKDFILHRLDEEVAFQRQEHERPPRPLPVLHWHRGDNTMELAQEEHIRAHERNPALERRRQNTMTAIGAALVILAMTAM